MKALVALLLLGTIARADYASDLKFFESAPSSLTFGGLSFEKHPDSFISDEGSELYYFASDLYELYYSAYPNDPGYMQFVSFSPEGTSWLTYGLDGPGGPLRASGGPHLDQLNSVAEAYSTSYPGGDIGSVPEPATASTVLFLSSAAVLKRRRRL